MGEFVMTNTPLNERLELLFECGEIFHQRHWKSVGLKCQEAGSRVMEDVPNFGMGRVQ